VEIESYLAKRIQTLKTRSSVVLDFRVFDFSYVPQKLLMRGEAEPIIDALVSYARTGIPQNLVVLGSRGCGKTLLMRYLQPVLKEKVGLEILYANCRNDNTSFKLLAGFVGASRRGNSLQELYQRFEARFTGRTVVVLDEVDLISKKDPNKDILYFLSRSHRTYMVICLSNNPRLLGDLDSSVRSSLQAEVLYLKNYDATQIAKILALRAQAGLREWKESQLNKIAALTAQRTNSDVRVAIKTLFYAVTGEGSDIVENFDRAQRDIYFDLISDLTDRNLLILRAAQLCPEKFVKKVFKRYEELSRNHGEASFSYVYFLNNLAYMQSLGLIMLLQTKVNRSYTSTVSLLFSDQVLDNIFRMRFG
jgi:Cdc6-like AAA superfamily ATPase